PGREGDTTRRAEPGRRWSQATHGVLRPRGPGWNGTRHAGRSRGVPGLRPPTECSGLAAPGGMGRDMLDGAGASLVSGHPRSAPASRPRVEWDATCWTEPGRPWSQATHGVL